LMSKWKRMPLPMRWILLVMVVLVGVPLAAVTVVFFRSKSEFAKVAAELPQAMAEAKAVGIPLKAEDLKPTPPVTEAENAAPLIRAAAAALGSVKDGDKVEALLLGPSRRADLSDRELMTKFAELARPLSLARQAAAKPRCDFGYDWDLGGSQGFTELTQVKNLLKLLCLRAEVEAQEGKSDDAIKDLAASFSLARHAGSTPTMISQLVRVSCDAIAIASAEKVAEALADKPAELARLSKALTNTVRPASFKECLRGEVYFGLVAIRGLRSFGEAQRAVEGNSGGEDALDRGDRETPPRPPAQPETVWAKAFTTRHLQAWTKAFKAFPKGDDPVTAAKALSKVAAQVQAEPGLTNILNKVLFPVFEQAGEAFAKDVAQLRCIRALVQVLRWKAAHGRFPDTLEEMGPVALDPFDGKPLKYIVTTEGVKVYSLGPNLVDDGGLDRREKPSGGDDYDVVSQYPAFKSIVR
jgi:hypothetical protein